MANIESAKKNAKTHNNFDPKKTFIPWPIGISVVNANKLQIQAYWEYPNVFEIKPKTKRENVPANIILATSHSVGSKNLFLILDVFGETSKFVIEYHKHLFARPAEKPQEITGRKNHQGNFQFFNFAFGW